MSQSLFKNYLYILIVGIAAITLVWIIMDSNRFTPSTVDRDSENPEIKQAEEKISVLRSKLISNPDDVDLNIELANVLFDAKKYNEAITFYRKVLTLNPEVIAAQIDLSICYYNLQVYDTAVIEMKKALKIDPFHMKGLFNIGVMYYNTSQVDSAKHYWSELLERYPETQEAEIARSILNNLNI